MQKLEVFGIFFLKARSMLYELFMFWVVASITVVAATMVLSGLLCVWCAYKGRKRARLESNSVRQPSHP